MDPILLSAPKITNEGACLLLSDCLPLVPGKEDQTVSFFSYSVGRKHSVKGEKSNKKNSGDEEADEEEEADGSGESCIILPLETILNKDIKRNDFPATSLADTKVIHVIDFIGCSTEITRILNAIGKYVHDKPDSDAFKETVSILYREGSLSTKGSCPIQGPSNLSWNDNFVTGISLSAAFKPEKFLTIFISFPFLCQQTRTNRTTGLSLYQYRFLGLLESGSGSGDGGEIMVHQAWFFIFNEETIAILRPTDKFSDRAPLFPYQQRWGGFHALVQMIPNILTASEPALLKDFCKNVSKQELQFNDYIKNDSVNVHVVRKLVLAFEKSLADISTMISVVQSQIKILSDLREIFQSSFEAADSVGELRSRRNAVKIPFILGEVEQILKAIETINAVIKEREEFRTGLSIWLKDLRCSKILSFQDGAALKQAESIESKIKKQGQTISLFTFFTTVLLPLGFLGQYFGIQFTNDTIVTRVKFWKIAAPTTVAIAVFMLLFVFIPDGVIKKSITGPIRTRFSKKKSDHEV